MSSLCPSLFVILYTQLKLYEWLMGYNQEIFARGDLPGADLEAAHRIVLRRLPLARRSESALGMT
jgi:hypothetical protein